MGKITPESKVILYIKACNIQGMSHHASHQCNLSALRPSDPRVSQERGDDVCRYLSTHRYNISLMHLVDQIASPYPKALMEQRTSLNLDAWPTPSDYYYNIREGKVLGCQPTDMCTVLSSCSM